VYPVELWVGGKRYGVSVQPVAETPVVYQNETYLGAPKITLVPNTKQQVIRLLPIAAPASKSPGFSEKTIAQKNALVVVYRQNGKFYYQSLPKLIRLETIAAQ
jgi:hypothetical protein